MKKKKVKQSGGGRHTTFVTEFAPFLKVFNKMANRGIIKRIVPLSISAGLGGNSKRIKADCSNQGIISIIFQGGGCIQHIIVYYDGECPRLYFVRKEAEKLSYDLKIIPLVISNDPEAA